ncbi:MAG: hypothetical protein WCP32_14455 [Bacteroidota bacterium]
MRNVGRKTRDEGRKTRDDDCYQTSHELILPFYHFTTLPFYHFTFLPAPLTFGNCIAKLTWSPKAASNFSTIAEYNSGRSNRDEAVVAEAGVVQFG